MHIIDSGRTPEQVGKAVLYHALQGVFALSAKGLTSVDLSGFEPVPPDLA